MRATPNALLLTALLGAALPAQPPDLPDFDRRTPVVLAVENVGPAVVNIRTQSYTRRPHLFSGLFQLPDEGMLADRSLGSGVIVHPEGYVVTNEHVIHGADRIYVTLQNGEKVGAELLTFDRENDLAILDLAKPGPFPTAVLGSSGDLMIGETTIALGNPFGLSSSVTTGILSATGRSVRFRGRAHFKDFLQTSALINPGNSGGPLLDINGRVIGINIAIDARGPGIGYAIPIDRVSEVLVDLVNPEIVKNAWLGFDIAERNGHLEVARVYEQGPAAAQGVRSGDRVEAVEGEPVDTALDFHIGLLRHEPGEELSLRFSRGGRPFALTLPFRPIPLSHAVSGSLQIHGMSCADLDGRLIQRLDLPADLKGVVVVTVEPGSTAHDLGVRGGDVLYQVGRYAVSDVRTLARVLQHYERTYGEAPVRVYRYSNGRHLEGTMVLR